MALNNAVDNTPAALQLGRRVMKQHRHAVINSNEKYLDIRVDVISEWSMSPGSLVCTRGEVKPTLN